MNNKVNNEVDNEVNEINELNVNIIELQKKMDLLKNEMNELYQKILKIQVKNYIRKTAFNERFVNYMKKFYIDDNRKMIIDHGMVDCNQHFDDKEIDIAIEFKSRYIQYAEQFPLSQTDTETVKLCEMKKECSLLKQTILDNERKHSINLLQFINF